MTRPTKRRRVGFLPEITFFHPEGVPPGSVEEICLSVEEAEALRLRDLEGLEQEECAQRMSISRPTFHRVLESARKKVADTLINGKALRIEGGNFEMVARRFRCARDGYEWQVPFDLMVAGDPLFCPSCNSPDVQPLPLAGFGRGGRGRHGRRWRGGWR